MTLLELWAAAALAVAVLELEVVPLAVAVLELEVVPLAAAVLELEVVGVAFNVFFFNNIDF